MNTFTKLLACLVILCGASQAADVYFSQSSAGGNTGADCADAKAVSTWGASQVAGNTLHLCGTITTLQLTVNASGSAGNPITIKFESGAKISVPACNLGGGSTICLVLDGQSYIVIDGGTACGPGTACNTAEEAASGTGTTGAIEATANGTGLANQVNSQAISMQTCTHCEVKNLIIRNMYVHTSTSDTTVSNSGPTCVTLKGSNNAIHDSTFHDVGWCVIDSFQSGDGNNEFYNLDIYRIDHGIVPSGPASSITAGPFWIHNNYIHSFTNWDAGSTYHHDAIHCFSGSASGQTVNGLYVYNNKFAGVKGTGFNSYMYIEGSTGPPCMNASSTGYFFNNVVLGDPTYTGSPASIWQISGGTWTVINNTILGDAQSSGTDITCTSVSSETWNNNVATKNAILVSSTGPCTFAAGSPDYDVYSLDGYSTGTPFYLNSGQVTYAGWAAGIGSAGEAHSANPGSSGISYTTGQPSAGSAVIGAGKNLYTFASCASPVIPGIGALCSDIAGSPRPSGGNWDAGAYQYSSLIPAQASGQGFTLSGGTIN